MEVGIITIGDELLSGETANTNATWLATELSNRGVSVGRIVVIPDVASEIVATIQAFRERFDTTIITGGLGPTHDDRTMEAVAMAFETTLEPDERVMETLTGERGYSGDDLTPQTTHIPAAGTALLNPVGVAPGVVIDSVYVLPGVPEEMKAMFETIAGDFAGPKTEHRWLLVDAPESEIAPTLRDADDRFPVAIGSYPGASVKVTITGTDRQAVSKAFEYLQEALPHITAHSGNESSPPPEDEE